MFLMLVFLMTGYGISIAAHQDVIFKSSIKCDMCKERIEKDLWLTKGVKSVVVDVAKKEIKVTYNDEKTTVDKLKKAITKIGYDADDLVADQKAHDHLPGCCQKGQECKH